MLEQTAPITGRCTDADGAPVPGLEVQAFRRSPSRQDQLIGATHTDDDGRYRIPLEPPHAEEVHEQGSLLFVQARRADVVVAESVLTPTGTGDLEFDLRLRDESRGTPGATPRWIHGVVRDELDRPMSDITVRALDRAVRSERVLGSAPTVDGRYEIRYFPGRSRDRAAARTANLVISVVDESGRELHRTPVLFGIDDDVECDVSLRPEGYSGPSRWELKTVRLQTLLGDVPPEEIRESDEFGDITFLAGQTGWSPLEVATWVACFRLAARTAQYTERVGPEVFYAFLSTGEPSLYRGSFPEDFRHTDRLELLDARLLNAVVELGDARQREIVEGAVAANVIPARARSTIEDALSTFHVLRRRLLTERSLGTGRGTVADLLALVPSAAANSDELLANVGAHVGPLEELWDSLTDRQVLPADTVRDLRRTFDLAFITRNHLPLVAALNTRLQRGEVSSMREFAKLSRSDWVDLISRSDGGEPAIGPPEGMDGDSEDERAQAYATRLDWYFERKYPTMSFAAKLDRSVRRGDGIPNASGAVARFLDSNPDFHLDRNRIDHYLADNSQARTMAEADPRLRSDLMAVQRVFRLQPTFTATESLLSRRLDSAQRIYELGEQRFLEVMADTEVGALDAQKIYRRAETSYATVLALLGEFNATINGVTPDAVPGLTVSDEQLRRIDLLPNLQTLFGSQDFCECAHCQSVYSPAAHFVDMIRFLDLRATNGTGVHAGKTCRQVLFERRPDLGEVELSCANTDTPLPYVDLVNEVLEEAVAPSSDSIGIDAAAVAEGPITARLREALGDIGLPVDEDARVERSPIGLEWIVRDSTGALTLSNLGLDTGSGVPLTEFGVTARKQTFGVADDLRAAPEHVNRAAYRDLATFVYPLQLPFDLWDEHARAYLNHLGVPQDRLMQLFRADGVGNGPVPSDAAIVNSRLGILGRTLFGAADLGLLDGGGKPWTFWGLRETGNDIPHPDFPDDPDHNIAGTWVEVLASVPVVLHRGGLTYAELRQLLDMGFVNDQGVVAIADNPSCDTATSRIDGWSAVRLARANNFIRLWRALGCTMWELDHLLGDVDAAVDDLPAASLASIADSMRVRDRTGLDLDVVCCLYRGLIVPRRVDRANGDAPVATVYDRVFRRDETLRTVFPSSPANLGAEIGDCAAALMAALQITETALNRALQALGLDVDAELDADALRRIFALTTLAKAAGISVEDMSRLGELTDGQPWNAPAGTLAFLDALDHIHAIGFSPAELSALLTADQAGAPPDGADDAAAFIERLRARYAKVGDAGAVPRTAGAQPVAAETLDLSRQRTAAQRRLFVDEEVAATLGVDVPIATQLLDAPAGTNRSPLRPAFEAVLAEPDHVDALSEATHAEAVDTALRRLRRSAQVITRLGLTHTDVSWWLADDNAQAMGWPEPLGFPVEPDDAPVAFERWSALQGFCTTWRAMPGTTVTAFEFADALTTPNDPEALAGMAGWPVDDFDTLTADFGWNDTGQEPERLRTSLRNVANLARLADCMAALRRLGVSAARARSWVRGIGPNGASQQVSADIKRVAQARYEPVQWRQVARPIEDDLREAKRRALVGHLVSRPDPDAGRSWHDSDGLYNHFLIDVEMSACMLTSRLVQATAAVQLFVQRCMLGLEHDVHVDPERDPRWRQWEWMKNYRVWEANRKVFLYPENWIEPELRDEKSQPFIELEQELLQTDVTADTVTSAYAGYLEKLEAVANLEIRTTVREHIDTGTSVLHVIGRSRSSGSGDHYYRRRVDDGRWTPWERIDLDIGSGHLIAAVDNHRLNLLWPQFVEKSEAPREVTTPQPGTATTPANPLKRWEVRLLRSERGRDRWSPKELVDGLVVIEGGWIDNDVHNIGLRVSTGEGLSVELANTSKAGQYAAVSRHFFHKIGRQVSAQRHFGGWDYFPPRGSVFFDSVIRHDGGMEFGFAKRPHTTGPWSPAVYDGVNTIHVLRNIPAGVAYTVLDSDATDPGETGTFFYFDWRRTYLVRYWSSPTVSSTATTGSGRPLVTGTLWQFHFTPHYHPFVPLFAEAVAQRGLPGLLNRQIQLDPAAATGRPAFDFAEYEPAEREDIQGTMDPNEQQSEVIEDFPVEEVDFSYQGAYSSYNWELFFHVPFLIASKLSANQRFDEALSWFHYIFDPIAGDSIPVSPGSPEPTPQQRFWVTKPFYVRSTAAYQASRIEAILAGAAAKDPALLKQVQEWRDNPFKPHLIARMRTVAYQKNVVMRYIQTLIAWGDRLFGMDTMESINEATQLYVLASAILGRRPRQVPATKPKPVRTYNELEALGLAQADPLIEVENLLPAPGSGSATSPATPALPQLNLSYFGLPHNDKLLGLWDLVEDRLFKIRNCMNLAGMVRRLPLFEPPIDPALLVKATAAGLSVAEALADMDAPLPSNRFVVGLQQARAAVEEVKGLGSALSSALEKRDAEALALLRQGLEQNVRQYVLQIRRDQIDEALRTAESLAEQRKTTQARLDHYRALLEGGWSVREKDSLALTEKAMSLETAGTVVSAIAGAMAVVPDFDAGVTGGFGSPTAKVKFGGTHLSAALQMTAGILRGLTSLAQMGASRASTISGYVRREEDWNLQKTLAEKELVQLDKQILAAQIRQQIATKEHQSQQIQIDNNQAETEYLQGKFTNTQLYDWMVAQCSFVYFQSYQLALDLAKRAERSFRFELGLDDSSYIQGPHWDSLRKGLLAGERLAYELRRLETAYHAQNDREYELTKHLSLAQLDPVALLTLKRNGTCRFSVPELAFDLDHPGHYFRRIKSISLSIPCVVGPYTTVGARLRLERGSIRISPALRGPVGQVDRYPRHPVDDRFREQAGVVNVIATSQAQQDAGVFQLDFGDPRYLPFEGAGAISDWELKLNNDPAPFDLDTITDVVVHMSYTAREDEVLAAEATKHAKNVLAGRPTPTDTDGTRLFRVIDLRREYADKWQRFRQATALPGPAPAMELSDIAFRLPYLTRDKAKTVHRVEIAATSSDDGPHAVIVSGLGTELEVPLTDSSPFEGLLFGARDVAQQPLGELSLQLRPSAGVFDELFLIIAYTID